MEKLTWGQVHSLIEKHNEEMGVKNQFGDKNPLYFVIVFKQENFTREFSEKSRSYIFRSDNKRFLPNMCGGSIYMDCLDGTDSGVRLDWIINEWKSDYLYQSDENGVAL